MRLLNFWRNKFFPIWVFILIAAPAQAGEGIIVTGMAPLMDSIISSRQEAIDAALIQAVTSAVQTVSPLPAQIVESIPASDFVQSYSIIQEKAEKGIYRIQIEARIDWTALARQLTHLGIINCGNGEKVLLFFALPQDIAFKTQILSFWQRFFLIFGLKPVYEEGLTREKELNYAFQEGIPFIFNFSITTRLSEYGEKSWDLDFTSELIYTTYNETIFQKALQERVFASDIEKLTQNILSQTQKIAYVMVPKLSAWLGEYKKKETSFKLIFRGVNKYKDIFDIWYILKNIDGIEEVCIKEITFKRIIYVGKYEGIIPDLVNQLSSLGWAIDQIRGNSIYLHRF